MNIRKERILENWLANTVRHCRATRLFDVEVHLLSREQQADLASACLDYFEAEAERRVGAVPAACGERKPPPNGSAGGDKEGPIRRPKYARQ